MQTIRPTEREQELEREVAKLRRQRDAHAITSYQFVFDSRYGSVGKLTFEEAGFLQDLMNRSRFAKWEGGWFWCSAKFMCGDGQEWDWSRKQERLFREFKRLGILRTKKKGIPPKRWVKINHDKRAELIGEGSPEYQNRESNSHELCDTLPTICAPNNTEYKYKGTKPPRSATPLPSRQGNSSGEPTPMGLFVNNQQSPKPRRTAPTAEDKARSKKLHAALAACGSATGEHLSTGTAEFRKLRQFLEQSNDATLAAARLDAAVDWLAEFLNGGGKMGDKKDYIPAIGSGKYFRQKFDQLEKAIARHKDRNPATTISDQAKAVATRLYPLGWRSGSRESVPLLVQVCMTRYAAVRSAISARAESHTPPKTTLDRAIHRLNAALPSPAEYAKQYLAEFVHNRTKWEKWDGDAAKLHWSQDCEHFANKCKKILTEYGSPAKWEDIREVIKCG